MNQYYIFPFKYQKRNSHDEQVAVTATIVYCESINNILSTIQAELKSYYETHPQTDELYVFAGEHLSQGLLDAFENNIDDVYRYIPQSNLGNLVKNTWVFVFDESRKINLLFGRNWHTWHNNPEVFASILNEGLLHIFIQRGGLIESNAGHHYVFPSGKHCNKFLRTGNILLYSAEISFIAFTLLEALNQDTYLQIYCDTSSINSLAFVLLELRRRILFRKSIVDPNLIPVTSFSSYEGLVKADGKRLENSLILISASTSANILDRIIEKHEMVNVNNIRILYYLGPEESFRKNKNQIMCNLTKGDGNENGVELYDTYPPTSCSLCKEGSYPSKINGDVFLPENPKIERIIFTVKDPPSSLNTFVSQFGSTGINKDNFLRASYKENGSPEFQYEIYMDMTLILKSLLIGSDRYKKFKEKLDDYVHQFIPSNVRFLICLPDEASSLLADYILSVVGPNYASERMPKKLLFNEINNIDNAARENPGCAVIVASCTSNGKNLLYLSRALREHDYLKLVYFIALSRMANDETLEFLKSNLRQGKYGKETNSVHVVEKINCTNEVKGTTWISELIFQKAFKNFVEMSSPSDGVLIMIDNRIHFLEQSMGASIKGIANGLFFPSIFDGRMLRIRKNYAFLSYPNYHKNVSQADVYFTVSTIYNKLRNSRDEKSLLQSEYVRKLIDPNNFNRFNDGVIQAAILRGAHVDEMCYHIDDNLSLEMRGILETIVVNNGSNQGEALLEFLYAIAACKMTMKGEHLFYLCGLIKQKVTNPCALWLGRYIEEVVLDKHSKKMTLMQENESLKKALKECTSLRELAN